MAQCFCSKCGQPMNSESAFCSKCGQPTENQGINQQSPIQQFPVNQVIYVQKPKIPGRGFGITSMVLGIIGAVYSFSAISVASIYTSEIDHSSIRNDEEVIIGSTMIGYAVYLLIFAVLSIVFAFCAIQKGFKRGQTIAGMVLGIITLIASIICFCIFI